MAQQPLDYRVRCSECSESDSFDGNPNDVLFYTEDALKCHIAMEHLAWTPFECTLCPMTCMPTESVLKRHYDMLHPGKMPRAIYTYDEQKKQQLRRIFSESNNFQRNGEYTTSIGSNGATQMKDYLFTTPISTKVDRFEEAEPIPKCHPTQKRSRDPQTSVIQASVNAFPTDYGRTSTPAKRRKTTYSLPASLPALNTTQSGTSEHEEQTPMPATDQKPKDLSIKNRKWCDLCQRMVGANRGNHIWQYHVGVKRFRCSRCSYENSKMDLIRQHARTKHDGDACWRDHLAELRPEYAAKHQEAFGTVPMPRCERAKRKYGMSQVGFEAVYAGWNLNLDGKRGSIDWTAKEGSTLQEETGGDGIVQVVESAQADVQATDD